MLILTMACPAFSDDTFEETYENYNVGDRNFWSYDNPHHWRPNTWGSTYYEVAANPTQNEKEAMKYGKKSMKFYNYRTSAVDGYRNEHIAWSGTGVGRARTFTIGEENWLAFSIYLPSDFVCDGCQSGVYASEHHMQIFPYPDRDARQRPGYPEEEWLQPVMGLLIDKDMWHVNIAADSRPVTPVYKYQRIKHYNLGSWLNDRGKWTDWVFHFKLDYTANGDNGGFLKVYKNDVLVLHDQGGNCMNDILGPYPVIGTYKYSWKHGPTDTDTRILYFDEFRTGDKNSTYWDVAPGGGKSFKLAAPGLPEISEYKP